MKLWTFQTMQAWKVPEATGRLPSNAPEIDPVFLSAYGWISRQMASRIGPPPSRPAKPLWAWYQWRGERQRKPDLRASGHWGRSSEGVRIELEVDESHALISDFDLWHYLVNQWFLPMSETEGDAFEAKLAANGLSFSKTKPLPNPSCHRAIEASWERIFDLDFSAADIASPRKQKSLQACLWEINLDDVIEVNTFRAR